MGNLSVTTSFDRIYTITRQELQQKMLFDQVSTRIALLFRMEEMGAIVSRPGGTPDIDFAVLKEVAPAQGYTDLGTLNISRGNPWTRVRYAWKQLATPVQISGLDTIKAGENGEIPLIQGMIEQALIGLREGIGGSTIGIFSALGETDLTGFTGLRNLLGSSTSTGTAGGHNKANEAWWNHQSENVASAFASNGKAKMLALYLKCARGDEVVDTIIFNRSTMANYETNVTSSQVLNMPITSDERLSDAGHINLKYKNAVILIDDAVPANFGWFLNLKKKYTQLVLFEGRQFEMGDFIRPGDGDYLVAHAFVAGNLCNINMARQGVLLNGDTN